MAQNVFAKSPVELASAQASARTRGVMESLSAGPASDGASLNFDTLARRSQVPQNVLEAAYEMSGLDGEKAAEFADRFSSAVGNQIAAGKAVKEAVHAVLSDSPEAADALLERAIQRVAPQEPVDAGTGQDTDRSVAADLARRAGSSVTRGAASALEGMGRGYSAMKPEYEFDMEHGPDGVPRMANMREAEGPSEMVRNSRAAADDLRGMADGIAAGISDEGKAAMEGFTFKGDLFKPSTWEMPENPSVEGLAHVTVDVLGSMAPVIVASLATRSPIAGAAAGGAQAGGAGAEQARAIVDEAAEDVDAAGVSRLAKESPYFQELIASGHTPEQALALTREAAEQTAAAWASIPGALGGAATGRILQGPLQALASRGAAARIGGTAAVSAAEEGAQEVAETVAGRHGVEQATGMEQDLTEGTLNDFVLGALGGGPVGAAGSLRRAQPTADVPPEDAASEASPAPDLSPEPAEAPEAVAEPAPAPSGPISRAAGMAPEMPDAPAPLMGGIVEGGQVRVEIPGGQPIDATFKAEDEQGVTLEANGSPFLIPRAQIEAGEVSLVPADPLSLARAATAVPPEQAGEPIPSAADAQPAAVQPNRARPAQASLQKRPFTHAVKTITGGIDPTGALGQELQHRGITPQTAPGLFRKGGVQSLDNLPAAEWGEYAAFTGEDGNGYLNEQGIIEALAEELAGKPIQNSEQMQLQEEADARNLLAELRELGVDIDADGFEVFTEEDAAVQGIFAPRSDLDDFTLGEDRANAIWGAIRETERDIGIDLTAQERRQVFENLDTNGGSVEDTLWWQLNQEPEADAEQSDQHREAGEDQGPPLFEPDAPGRGGEEGARSAREGDGRPGIDAGTEEAGAARTANADGAGSEADADVSGSPAPALQEQWWKTLPKTRHAARQAGLSKEALGDAWADRGQLITAVNTQLEEQGHGDLAFRAQDPDENRIESANAQPDEKPAEDPIEAKFTRNREALPNFKKGTRVEYTNHEFTPPRVYAGTVQGVASKQQGILEVLVDGGRSGNGWDVTIGAALLRPEGTPKAATEATPEGEQMLIPGVEAVSDKSRAESEMAKPKQGGNAAMPEGGLFDDTARNQADLFDAAASEADPNPTPAQAEAGNYKKGHIRWNGLDLAIETAKGEERRGTAKDGTEWSVTMPAHYGDLKRTEGADGDPLDFYMGDNPDSNTVVIVNQVDPKTRKFDEHKIIFGTHGVDDALKLYRAGFSDGSGDSRIGSYSATDVDSFKGWMKDQNTTKPTSKIEAKKITRAEWDAKPDDYKGIREDGTRSWLELDRETGATVSRPVQIEQNDAGPAVESSKEKPEYGAGNALVSKERAAELRDRLKAKLRDQLNSGIDPEIMAIGAELAVFHIEAGARKFADLARAIADDLGTTPAKLRPYLRSWYNGARDMMEDNGVSIDGMDDADAVREALNSGVLDAAPVEEQQPTTREQSTSDGQGDMFAAAPKEDAVNDNRDHAGDGGTGTEESAGPAEAGTAGEVRPQAGAGRGAGNRSAERAVERSEQGADGAGNRDGERAGRSPERPRARNHVIPAGGLELARGEKTRARESIAAIKVLRDLETSGLAPTNEQREALAKYGGAGTLAGALPRKDGSIRHADLAAELDGLLTEEEAATLSKTSQYAFYTAESALRSMWRLAEQLGFRGGRVYEPGMGVGGFAGTMPEGVRAATSYEGLELDHVTAKIAQKLYPAHTIKQGDFIKARLPRDYYDLAIGNPPFSGTRIEADSDYPQRFMIHDYFFAKTLDSVRPGGLLMFVTSAGTMNKLDSKARDYLADRADLVGAIRLPNTAFKENGTEVTTDIIVLRKRAEGEAEADPSWRHSDPEELPNTEGGTELVPVNRYFINNPSMILGEQGVFDTLTANSRVGVRPLPGADLAGDLRRVVADKFPSNIMDEAPAAVKLDALDTDSAEKKTGSYYIKDGELYQYDGRAGNPVKKRGKGVKGGKSKTEFAIIKQLIPIKDALRNVYAADLNGQDAKQARRELNRTYDEFVRRNGPIGKQVRSFRRPSAVELEGMRQQALQDARAAGADFDIGSFDPSEMLEGVTDPETGETKGAASLRDLAAARKAAMAQEGYKEGDFNPDDVPDKVIVSRPNIDAFMEDPESYRLLAIEKYDEKSDTAEKSLVFRESAVTRSVEPQLKSPEDALLYLLGETGRVDLEQIAEKIGSDKATVRKELGNKIFRDPASGEYETRSKYLSGNVRRKLDEARKAALGNPDYRINVTELEAVQPEPVTAEEIRVPIGAHWFDAEVYSDFAKSLGMSLTVKFNRKLGMWAVIGGDTTSAAARNEWGSQDKPFGDLMALVLNNKKIEVRRRDQEGKTWVDEEATQEAKDKARLLQDRFSDWFWEDEKRGAAMEDLYNKTFNAEVAPAYDGGYLTTPGINSAWRWRPHQTAVIARILQSGSTYMAHTVGAGKTSAMIGAGMEARRLGLAKKPMYAVPNHMLVQFTTEFYQQYPLAKILVADEKRFHTSTRKQFIADAALGDWDAIIITHSGFGKIPPSEAAVNRVVSDMVSDIKSVLDDTQESGFGTGGQGEERAILGALGSMASILGLNVKSLTDGQNSTRKKIEALIEAAEQRMSRQIDRRDQDQVFNFDELGVDMLFVDEAHLFRKLSFATTNGNIKGIDPAGSQSSMDLFIKARALDEVNPGRGLVLASGTPLTNTMAELYTVSRYLQPAALKERGIASFDAWASTFGSVESDLEQLPDGGYKQIARFSKFVNTPELSLMVRQIMDVITGQDLEQYVTRPALKNGKRNLVLVEPSAEVKAYQSTLAIRMDKIANRKGPVKKGDDILLSVINDGRLSAIDTRLVGADQSGAGSKLEALINNVYRNWKQGANSPLHGVKPEGGYTDAPIEHGPTTQIVFSTLGVNPTRHNPAFSVHRFVKSELVRMGVPASDIVLAEDLKTHALKQRAFNDMNEGKKRILIGSKSLFTGVNAQRRLAAIHNLDPLWFPADDEQRNGRGLRQGNMNPEIEINDYSTKGTYDATMWQMMARKAGFIEGFFRGDPNMREMEDLGEASQYQQATALSTRDPRVLELTELRQKRDELDRRRGSVDRQRRRLANEVRNRTHWADQWSSELKDWQQAAGKVEDLKGDKFKGVVRGAEYEGRKELGQALIDIAIQVENESKRVRDMKVGTVSGFPLLYTFEKSSTTHYIDVEPFAGQRIEAGFSFDPVGLARRIEGAIGNINRAVPDLQEQIEQAKTDAAAASEQLAKVKDFDQLQELRMLEEQVAELESELESDAEADQKARSGDKAMRSRRPVAVLTGAELEGGDIRELRRAAQHWYRDNLSGQTVTTADGWIVRFGARGLKKSTSKGDGLLRVIPALKEIIAQGEVVETRPGFDAATKAMHFLSAPVEVAGETKRYVVAIRETADGKFQYDLSWDVSGKARPAADGNWAGMPISPVLSQPSLSFNLGVLQDENKREPKSEPGELSQRLNKELERFGISARVTARAWRSLKDGPLALDGMYRTGEIHISASASDGIANVMRHEVIHAMRDPALWGKPYGLFSQAEWRQLVREARNDKGLMDRVKQDYPDLSGADLMEEAVAELYRQWGIKRDAAAPLGRLFQRMSGFLKALANALRGRGFTSAARVFEQMERAELGRRGDDGPNGPGGKAKHKRRSDGEPGFEKGPSVKASTFAKGAAQLMSDALTQAMAGKNGANLLSLVPGRPLFSELGAKLPALQTYLGLKQKMDTLRNHWHAETDQTAQRWRNILTKDREANGQLMDLMHDSTIDGQDPSKPFLPLAEPRDPELVRKYGKRSKTGAEAWKRIEEDRVRKAAYEKLRERFQGLPLAFRELFIDVRDAYNNLADEFENAIEANAEKAMTVAVRRAEREHERTMQEIRDDGLKGKERDEAKAAADAKLKTAKLQNQWSKGARLQTLRARFESNRLSGPYFPLARFGDFYVTLRDEDGKVVSFSRFEKRSQQRKFAEESRQDGYEIETGVIHKMQAREAVDPGFVADVESLLDEINADETVMDAIWQRWLHTLPDMSARRSRLHRKGTKGFSADAFRAFGNHMFHGAHQLARLTYSLDMAEALDVAEQEARRSKDPERAGLIVQEAARRHEYVMNPKGSAWAQTLTSAAFVYYLSMTPAAALVNLTQTTVVGIPMLGAYWGKGGAARATAELTKASRDFLSGGFEAAKGSRLTEGERKALNDAYELGTIDKSQSHDLAGVGETGVEYSPIRTKVMGVISYLFHHAERANREVTFLAAYRMARAKGLQHEAAVERAADLTWKTHFDYQNTSRPRLLQNDFTRVAFVFRNFQINMLWRLFRDSHQVFQGDGPEVQAEARRQLLGITSQMMLQAGVKGVWGYSILKMLAGMFFAGGGDEAEKEMEKALLAVLPRDAVGALLNGVPGHLLGIDLRSRIGMPDLWFRSPDRQLEGEDEYNFWVQQVLGAVPGIAQNLHRGAQQAAEGHLWRGTETASPKFVRDLMRSGRYFWEGAQTYNGDDIVDEFTVGELIAQALGFTPARLSEQYDANTRLKNEEQSILGDRKAILRDAGKAVKEGRGIPEGVMEEIQRFNEENPDYPITGRSLNRSIKARQQASARNEGGVQLNQKLNRRLRDDAAPLIYGD